LFLHQLNNNFYTFQPYSVQRQYFRDASLIGAQSGTDIVIGSAIFVNILDNDLEASVNGIRYTTVNNIFNIKDNYIQAALWWHRTAIPTYRVL
jgi:hypothetical protein